MAWPLSCNLFLLTLIPLQSSFTASQNSGNFTIGQSLSATTNGSPLLSPSGDFAFGFTKISNSSNLFLLAIWYDKIPENPDNIVWYANDGSPVPEGSSVKITANEGLVLSDPQGNNIWNTSNDITSSGVNYGFMNDTGNFALKTSSNDNPVWQSFGHPTDTLLPGQVLEMNVEVNSRRSSTNLMKGRFQLRLIPDGNLVLNTRDLATNYAYGAYYTSGTNDEENPGRRLIYNDTGHMYIVKKNGSIVDLFSVNKALSAKDNYLRATLSFDGVFTQYYIPKSSITSGWSISTEKVPENICMTNQHPGSDLGSGICGFNSVCSLGDDKKPTCTCPQGYSPLDPNEEHGGCKPDFKLEGCEGYEDRARRGEYKLVHLSNTDWPFNDYEKLDSNNEEDCKNSCWIDCFCAAAIFQDSVNPGCWKKKSPLSNGRKDTRVEGTLWIKVGTVNNSEDPFHSFVPPIAKNKVNTLTKVLFGGSISVNVLLLSAIGLGLFFIYHKRPFKAFDEYRRITLREYSNVHCFSYQELKEATDGFKEELGRGSFGIVYKGMISGGGLPLCIAVKKLDRISGDTDKEFKTEVNVIGRTHHKNLVQLVGFCKEEDQRLLVYEYMSNGSLADYLFGNVRPSWINRVQISQGIARGLLYLHEECSTQIIHCDIKPQNILLDEYQNARISDFGLAKLLVLNQTHTNTAIRGTKGYVAPEWFRNKPVTVKVDVYSFGVLLLEIICCRKSVCMELVEEEGAILTDWAFDCYQSNRFESLVYDDMEALDDIIRLKRLVNIALWCVQEDPSLRPTMLMVTQMLEGLVEVPNNPPGPTLYSVTTQYETS